ncbi:MAG: DUF116 domain-containing protein [Caulobacteraceae bacterium]
MKGEKIFILFAVLLILLLLLLAGAAAVLWSADMFSTYKGLLVVIITILVLFSAFVAFTAGSVISANKEGTTSKYSGYLLKLSMAVLMPLFIFLADVLRGDKDSLRELYIRTHNRAIQSGVNGLQAGKLLVLLPHCMQNRDCTCKITENLNNCKRCGNCRVGEISTILHGLRVNVAVAKGGTAARNIVKELKPDCILAVACERELVSGIADVKGIPVIGLINQRPDGYCSNTTVDVALFKNIIQKLLGEEKNFCHASPVPNLDTLSKTSKNLPDPRNA